MRRHLVNGAILGGLVLAFWACSPTAPAKPPSHPDGGHATDAGPDAGGVAAASSSTAGSAASSGASGTSSGGATSSGGSSGGSCTHRSDCPNAQACLGGHCGVEGPDAGCASNDQCVKTFICQADSCKPGCNSNLDCHGTQLPKCVLGNPGHCSACTANADCRLAGDSSTANELCQSGHCTQPTSCTTAATCNNLGCVSGFCGNCTSDADCISGTSHCDPVLPDGGGSGTCLMGANVCSTDTACQADHDGGAGWFCGGNGACQLGCVPDVDCSPPQRGCCNAGMGLTCSATTHNCATRPTSSTSSGTTGNSGTIGTSSTGSSGSTGVSCDCSPCTNLGEGCNQANNCACVPNTGTTGSTGCDCSPCTNLGEGCDPTMNCSCVPNGTTGGTGSVDPCCATQSFGAALACGLGVPACGFFGCCDPLYCCGPGPGTTGTTGTSGTTGTTAGCPSTHNSGQSCDTDCKCASGLACKDGNGTTYSATSSTDITACTANWDGGCMGGLICQ